MAAAPGLVRRATGGIEGAAARAYLGQARHRRRDRSSVRHSASRPTARGKLKAALADFGEDKLVEAGLLIQPEDEAAKPYDRFRGRLT